jgi:hypothetical protein
MRFDLFIRSAFFDRAGRTHKPFDHYQVFSLNNQNIVADLSTVCSVVYAVSVAPFTGCSVFVEWVFAVGHNNPTKRTPRYANGEIINDSRLTPSDWHPNQIVPSPALLTLTI